MAGSKKYKDKICVYCRENASSTADHVFPREFFQIEKRNNLPKVPSCKDCNNEKSKLEHYLSSVLPFGATHSDAEKSLSVDAFKRLQKNNRLHSELSQSYAYRMVPTEKGGFEQRLAIEIDYKSLHELVSYIGRALIFHHWGKYLPSKSAYTVFTPSPEGMKFVSSLMNLSSNLRVHENLGGDTVRYKGVMSESDEGLSIWAIQLFGGMTVADDNLGYIFKNSFVAMVTGTKQSIDNLNEQIET